ncbi:hypothetical protein [Streptomyces sp. NPDC003857]
MFTAQFSPVLAMDSTAKAGRMMTIPIRVLGSAVRPQNVMSLRGYVSYDGGKNWKALTVRQGKVVVRNPAVGKGISFRAEVTDTKGDKATLSIYNAYRGM